MIIDFTNPQLRYRQQHASLRNEALARALGCKPQDQPRIIDATAGLGRDSFILASLGFTVIMLERSPQLYSLLEDALQRARQVPDLAPIIQRMQLIQADAITWLAALSPADYPDIIYLDPMFPERTKSAKVKKEMIFLQDACGNDEDADKLLQVAAFCAKKRIIVKRPRMAPTLAGRQPDFQREGRSCRFDVYLNYSKQTEPGTRN